LTRKGLTASVIFHEADWAGASLADFLEDLDEAWRGWEGEKLWGSMDGELRLTVTHPKKNTVLVGVVLDECEGWRCEAEIEVDPGVFRQPAAEARRLGAAPVAGGGDSSSHA
jgi:hypothetical protein